MCPLKRSESPKVDHLSRQNFPKTRLPEGIVCSEKLFLNFFLLFQDSRSTFPIIDDEGCPVDPTIFPRFTPEGNALVSVYEAFRFTESYGVIFQCNVKYCLGPCEPVRRPPAQPRHQGTTMN